jgi:translation initiation factor IF-3
VREIRVIDADGAQLGIMPPEQALSIALEKELDLVEVAPQAVPPVCRIMNAGKFFYEQSKRENEARKHQKHIQIKEVKFRPKVDDHDFDFKKRNVERFLAEGNKVKSLVQFRGREIVHSHVGLEILRKLATELGATAIVEVPPKLEGNMMTQILSPGKELAKLIAKNADQKAKGGKPEKSEKHDKGEKSKDDGADREKPSEPAKA